MQKHVPVVYAGKQFLRSTSGLTITFKTLKQMIPPKNVKQNIFYLEIASLKPNKYALYHKYSELITITF